jgi:hypothetical protein
MKATPSKTACINPSVTPFLLLEAQERRETWEPKL